MIIKRAKKCQKPKHPERARTSKKPKIKERARLSKKPKIKERAMLTEQPTTDERSTDLVLCPNCDNWPSDCRCGLRWPEDSDSPLIQDEPEL